MKTNCPVYILIARATHIYAIFVVKVHKYCAIFLCYIKCYNFILISYYLHSKECTLNFLLKTLF